MEEGACN